MIWAKTDAGRAEMQARALVKERAQRNLLLVIDGIKTEEMLLANLAGIGVDDFAALQALGLIAPAAAPGRPGTGVPVRPNVPVPVPAPLPTTLAPPQTVDLHIDSAPLDYAQFTSALTQIISRELGLRGFVLTLSVEKANSIEELQAVAQRALAQIADRKGEAVAAAARRALYGG